MSKENMSSLFFKEIGKRKPNINHYEKQIIFLSVMPSVILMTLILVLLFILIIDIENALNNQKTLTDIAYVNHWLIFILGLFFCFFTALLYWIYKTAKNMLGAFTRVKRELMLISEGIKKDPIILRDKDLLLKELVDIMNKIIIQNQKK